MYTLLRVLLALLNLNFRIHVFSWLQLTMRVNTLTKSYFDSYVQWKERNLAMIPLQELLVNHQQNPWFFGNKFGESRTYLVGSKMVWNKPIKDIEIVRETITPKMGKTITIWDTVFSWQQLSGMLLENNCLHGSVLLWKNPVSEPK